MKFTIIFTVLSTVAFVKVDLQPCFITLPTDASVWSIGTYQTISWINASFSTIDVYLLEGAGPSLLQLSSPLISNAKPSPSSLQILVPNVAPGTYTIQFGELLDFAYSNPFSIIDEVAVVSTTTSSKSSSTTSPITTPAAGVTITQQTVINGVTVIIDTAYLPGQTVGAVPPILSGGVPVPGQPGQSGAVYNSLSKGATIPSNSKSNNTAVYSGTAYVTATSAGNPTTINTTIEYDQTFPVAVMAGVTAAGIAILVLICVIVVVIIRRRRSSPKYPVMSGLNSDEYSSQNPVFAGLNMDDEKQMS